MKITKIVDTPEGKMMFECEMNSDQHRFIFETGLGYLVSVGAINLAKIIEAAQEDEPADVVITTTEPTLN